MKNKIFIAYGTRPEIIRLSRIISKLDEHCDHILVHTNNQKEEMLRMDMFKNLDIRVFPLGVDTNVFRPLVESANLDHKRDPELLYVGRIIELKRIHIAIETLSALIKIGYKKARLKIIGPVSSKDYYYKLIKLAKDENLLDNVEFIKEKNPILERLPLISLSKKRQLIAYKHKRF